MKKIFAALLLFTAMSAQAASVTIDFEEPISSSVVSGELQFESKGYLITTGNPTGQGNYSAGIYQSGGNRYFSSSDFILFGPCYCTGGGFIFERADGGAFAVESAGISAFSFDSSTPVDVSGVTGSGTSVLLSLNTIGTGDWLNLKSFQVVISGADSFNIAADNIVVSSVVPIPAAVWLFASGLGVVGWMKRKRVA